MTIVAIAGCASSPALDQASPSMLFTVVAMRPATQPIPAETIIALDAGHCRFAVLDQDGQISNSILITRSATTEHGATTAVADGDARIEFLKHEDDGSIALTAVIDRKDNALTLFNPALVVAPATLQPGETFVSEAAMRVVALDNPTKQREKGSARRTLTYAADGRVRTPAGEFETARLEIHFTADLRFADADERTTLYVSRDPADGGTLVQQSREKITILGAFPRESARTLVRE